jgi:zinc protease
MRKFCLYVAYIIISLIFFSGGSNLLLADYYKETLDNGLVVILKEDHTNPIVSMRIYIRAGSIYEEEHLGAGLSHFVEHMLMEGTVSGLTKEEIEERFDDIGSVGNAATWRDYTTYYETLPSKHLNEGLELFAQSIFEADFIEETFNSQRDIILREIEMGKDEPSRILQKAFYLTAFSRHPIRYPTIGFLEEFKKVTLEELRNYYKNFYTPNNSVLCLVGDFQIKDTLKDIKEIFGKYPYKPIPQVVFTDEPEQYGKKEKNIKSDFSMSYIRMGFHTMSTYHPDMPAMDVLSNILTEGRSSILNVRIKQTKGLVEEIYSWNFTPTYDAGTFTIYATMEDDNVEKAISAILDEIRKLKEEELDKKTIEKAISQAKAEILIGSETTTTQAQMLASSEFYYGNPEFDNMYIEMLEKVTPEDVMRVAKKYLYEDNMTIVRLSKNIPENITEEDEKESKLKLSDFTLDNGMRVIVANRPTAPTVFVGAYLLGGTEYDPEGKLGLSRFVSKMLVMGADGIGSVEIAEEIETLGGKLEADSGISYNSLKLTILSENLDKGFEIFSKCLTKPDFRERPFKQQIRNAINDCISEDDDWGTEAFKGMKRLLFHTETYQTTSNGKLEDIKTINLEDVKDFYQRRFHPENIVLTFVGDISEEKAYKLATEYLGKWKKDTPVKKIEKETENIFQEEPTEKEENWKHGQTVLCYGYPAFERGDDDRYAVLVLDSVLSGVIMPKGRLHKILRSGGYVYLVHAFNNSYSNTGYFAIYLATTQEKYSEVKVIIEEELEKIKTEPVPEEELKRAKEGAISAKIIYNLQYNQNISDQMALDMLNGIDYKDFLEMEEKINAVTQDDILRVANKYLDKEFLFIGIPRE